MGKTFSTGLLTNGLAQDSSNNIGIGGAANASFKLQVTGTTNLTGALSGTSASFSGAITSSVASGNGSFYINNASLTNKNWTLIPSTSAGETDLLFFYTGASSGTRMTLTNSGNLGIGTTNPRTLLDIGVITTANTNGSYLRFGSETGGTYGAGVGAYTLGGVDNVGLKFYVNPSFNNTNLTALTINNLGNVGVGTNSIDQKFVINQGTADTFNQGIPAASGTNQKGILRLRPSATFFGETLDFGMNVGPTYGWIQSTNAGNLATNYNLALNPNGGNIGIGTSDIQGQLDVFKSNSGGLGGHIMLRNNGAAVANETAVMFVDGGADSLRGAISCTTEDAPYFGAIKFKTGAGNYASLNTRMIITGAGDLCVGKNSASWTLNGLQTEVNGQTIGVTNSSGSTNNLFLRKNAATGAVASFYYDNTLVGSISITSSVTSYNVTSDYRLKQDLKGFIGLDLISKIKTYDYQWKSDKTRMYGVLAHELAEVLPYLVHGQKDELDENGNYKMQGVDYSKIVPILVKAIQEQQAQIEELKALIAAK